MFNLTIRKLVCSMSQFCDFTKQIWKLPKMAKKSNIDQKNIQKFIKKIPKLQEFHQNLRLHAFSHVWACAQYVFKKLLSAQKIVSTDF